MTVNLTTTGLARIRTRVYALPTVREVPLPPSDGGTPDTW